MRATMATEQSTDRRTADAQRDAFGQLARDGVYSDDFAHPPHARAFFADIIGGVAGDGAAPLRILDCGCGTGAWLAEAHALLAAAGERPLALYGFDLTAEMVAIAADKLGRLHDQVAVHEGDILNADSYRFDGLDGGFDIVFAYDVVQQLPRARQAEAVRTMLAQLAPGGRLFAVVGNPPVMQARLITRRGEQALAQENLFETELKPLVGVTPADRFEF